MTSSPQHLRLVPNEESGNPVRTPAGQDQPDSEASRALEHVVNRFDAFIRRSARRHGLVGPDVDEVVQELRVRMWRSLGTAALIRRAKATYIYRTAISAALDIIRRRRTRRAETYQQNEMAIESAPDPRRRSDAAVDEGELAAAVHRALNMLAESRRAVVRMHLAGYDRFEIADLLGWSEAKTRNLLYRGLGDLREILLSWGIGPEKGT